MKPIKYWVSVYGSFHTHKVLGFGIWIFSYVDYFDFLNQVHVFLFPLQMHFTIMSSGTKMFHWVSRIKELSRNERWHEVFSQYIDMNKFGIKFTEPSHFHPILKACSIFSLRHGKEVHASVIKLGFESCTSTMNSVMDLYLKSCVLNSARDVFDSMKCRDSVSWNIIIRGHLDQDYFEEGLWLFSQARVVGFEPNVSNLVLIFQVCRNLGALHDGQKIQGYIIRSGFWAISSVKNSLLSLYVDIGMEHAQKLFDEMSERDVISWSVMIEGYVQSEEVCNALGLFREMVAESEIELDGQTIVSAVKACSKLGDINLGRLFHGYVICEGFGDDLFLGNSLVDMYSKCSDFDSALKVFDEIPRKNAYSWNSLVSGFVHNERHSEALVLYNSMQKSGIEVDGVTLVNLLQICNHFRDPYQCKYIHSMIIRQAYESNPLVMNALINAYAECDLVYHARKLFNRMKERDLITWSTMIAGFTSCGLPDDALSVFREMNQAHEWPNTITMLNLLKACSSSAELKRSKWAHGIVIRRLLTLDVTVGTAVLDMYAKCGSIDAAKKAFRLISKKNVVSWSAMIAAYGINGLAYDALALLPEMNFHGVKPNSVTALSILSACSHGGLIKEGLSYFQELVKGQTVDLRSEHYSCVVDLLSRGGKLDVAMEMIRTMPEELKPRASAWGALLSACRNYGSREVGKEVVYRVIELEPYNSGGYLLGSNMHAAGRYWVDAAKMRGLVKERGIRVVPGHSLVHVNAGVCRFVAGGDLPEKVCVAVEGLHKCMKMEEREDESM